MIDILWELENASRSELAEIATMPEGLWVEHILPQSWTEEWPFEDGVYLDPESVEPNAVARRTKLHSLGNLTLLTPGLNRDVSNKKLSVKQEQFNKHTGLFLNKWFQNHTRWTEVEISKRGEHLANLAVATWKPL